MLLNDDGYLLLETDHKVYADFMNNVFVKFDSEIFHDLLYPETFFSFITTRMFFNATSQGVIHSISSSAYYTFNGT